MPRLKVDYDGEMLRLTGWLPSGPALLRIPGGGQVELRRNEGEWQVICRDRKGTVKPLRVSEETGW